MRTWVQMEILRLVQGTEHQLGQRSIPRQIVGAVPVCLPRWEVSHRTAPSPRGGELGGGVSASRGAARQERLCSAEPDGF